MWQVIGQNRNVSLLQNSLKKDSLAHAYLIVGPTGIGKMTLALDLASAMNCNGDLAPCGECESCRRIASGKYSDVEIIGLSGDQNCLEMETQTEIGVDRIREIQRSACLPPFEGRYKVFIIDGAELLSIEAANCLLKTLEEPESKVVFLLLSSSEGMLPATVVSRCQRLELLPLARDEVEDVLESKLFIEKEKARLLARLCHGCLGRALRCSRDDDWQKQRAERLAEILDVVDNYDYEGRLDYAHKLSLYYVKNKGSIQEILDLWLDWWHDLLLAKIGSEEAVINVDCLPDISYRATRYNITDIRGMIDAIQAVSKQLKLNANPQLVFEVLMLGIPERRV